MPVVKKILFPVDFSKRCIGAARYVRAFASQFGAEIMLLHVVETGDHYYPEVAQPHLERDLTAFLIDEFHDFQTLSNCIIGATETKIVETASSWRSDLIMMPTSGLGRYRRFLLGSITAKVLHDAECPVWTDIHSQETPTSARIACKKVLCALDLGERSRAVLDWAGWLAREHQADLRIVHAAEAEAGPLEKYLDREFAASGAAEARTRIAELQGAAGTSANVAMAQGKVSDVVTCAAKEWSADLLVIGRHNGSGLAGRLHQNAYSIIGESPCPVLSV
ncbi:MAG: universal stress protein [Bryobacteraceae bacterium]